MRHTPLRFCLALALMLSGWGGALAASFCAHAHDDASAMRACCRARIGETAKSVDSVETKAHGGGGSHCSTNASESAVGHTYHTDDETENETQQSRAAQTSQSDHADQVHHAEPLSTDEASGADSCAHCLSRGSLPRGHASPRETDAPRRTDAVAAPPAQTKSLLPAVAGFSPEIVPSQHAPPQTARRHLIINVFLI